MMIKKIEIFEKRLRFKNAFEIAYEKVNYAKIIFIKITDGRGNYGLGSAAVSEEYAGESAPRILKVLRKNLKPEFFSVEPAERQYYHEKIQRLFTGFPSAQSAVEEAVLNLYCRQNGLTFSDLFGKCRNSARLLVTIGIKNEKSTLNEVKKRLKEGFTAIKLKCGLALDEDIKKIKAVIDLLPKKAVFTLDANQGYTFAQAKKLLKKFNKTEVSLIEQPIAAKNLYGLKKLCALKTIPVIADEAVVTVQDAFKIMSGNFADGVNVKLMKCGGPLNFLKICDRAKKLKKIAMIGCVYESNISITTGAYLALARPLDYVDLDSGHLDFPDDPAKGGAIVIAGKIQIGRGLTLQ